MALKIQVKDADPLGSAFVDFFRFALDEGNVNSTFTDEGLSLTLNSRTTYVQENN